MFLGLLKLLLGLFASEIALAVFNGFPNVLLCILVIAAGLELVSVGESLNTARSRDLSHVGEGEGGKGGELTVEERKRRWAVMSMTVAGILAFKNDAVGFLAGMLCYWSFKAQDRYEEGRGEGRIRLGEGREGERSV